MTHEEAVARWLRADGVGVEIGAFKTPVPGIQPIYVDRFAEYAGEKCIADYWGDACELPFLDHSLDYVVTCHVLEHVANPVAALAEWHRVLKPGGVMYMVVPDRRFTWDHSRALTEPEHMWQDFVQGTSQADGTHIDDFVHGIDWSTYSPDTPAGEVAARQAELRNAYQVAVAKRSEINIHFHVFEPSNLRALIELAARRLRLEWTIVAEAERFPQDNPNGTLIIVRVGKGLRARVAGWELRYRRLRDRRAILQPGARLLHETA